MSDEIDEKRNISLHPADPKLLQTPLDVAGGLVMRESAGGDLHQQRVEVGRDDGAREGRAGVETDAHATGRAIGRHPPVVGEKAILGILSGHAALDRGPHRADRLLVAQAHLRIGELVALGHEQLPPHDVDAGDLLRDRVLHLDPRIHFDEEKLARVGVDKELDRAGVFVAGRAADGEGRLADRVAGLRIKVGRGG